MVKIHTDNNVADLLTKAFDVKQSNMVGFGVIINNWKSGVEWITTVISSALVMNRGKVTLLFDFMLVQNQAPDGEGLEADEAVHKEGVTGMDTRGSLRRQDTMGDAPAQTRSERVLEQPIKRPLSEGHTSGSREGRMEHQF
ncbi:hypothetical protein Tco_0984540 [Tanacetum coccineum]